MKIPGPLGNMEIGALEGMYRNFLEDPLSVDESWRFFSVVLTWQSVISRRKRANLFLRTSKRSFQYFN